MTTLYEDPWFTFRFADDRIIPRFQLEGIEAGRRVVVYKIDPDSGERLGLLKTASVGEGGWVDLPEPITVRAGEAFIAVPETGQGQYQNQQVEFTIMATSKSIGEPIVIDAHGRHAQAVAFSKDGKLLVSTGQDACIRLWSVPSFKAVDVIEGHTNSVNSISFSQDGALLATGSTDGTVRVWSFPEGKCLHVLPKQMTGQFSPDGKHLATISAKGRIVLWDAKSGNETKAFPAFDKRITALAFTSDAATLLVGGTGLIHRISIPEGGKVGELAGHKVVVACLRLTPDGKLLASTGADGTVRLWSTKDWSEVRKWELRASGVLQMAIAPKGDVVAVSTDNLIQTFSLKEAKLVGRIEVPVKGVYGLAISPDARYLANAAADGKVRVWER